MSDQPSNSRAPFPATTWKLIQDAQQLPASQRGEALGQLVQAYWKPIYAYFRSKSKSQADAEELVQAFLYDFVRTEKIQQVDQQRGKFRTWLRACLDNYLISWERKRRARKRMPDGAVISFEQLAKVHGKPFEPADRTSPDEALLDAWRRDLLEKSLQLVEDQCRQTDRLTHYNVFAAYYCNTSDSKVTWKQIAHRFGLSSWKDAARKADWVKEQLGRAIREQVAVYAESDDEIEDEIRKLYH